MGRTFTGLPQISYGTCVGVDNGNDHAAVLFPDIDPASLYVFNSGGSMSNGCSVIDWMISLISGVNQQRIGSDELKSLQNRFRQAQTELLYYLTLMEKSSFLRILLQRNDFRIADGAYPRLIYIRLLWKEPPVQSAMY